MNKEKIKIDKNNNYQKIYFDAEVVIRIEDEFGHPIGYQYQEKTRELWFRNTNSSEIEIHYIPGLIENRNIKINEIISSS